LGCALLPAGGESHQHDGKRRRPSWRADHDHGAPVARADLDFRTRINDV